jgi:hypothetical protein
MKYTSLTTYDANCFMLTQGRYIKGGIHTYLLTHLLTYLLTYLLTEPSPSWEAANCAANQEFPSILRNPKVHHRVHKSPSLVPILSQIDPVHTIPFYLSKIYFNIIFSPPTATWGCAMPWWQGTHLTWKGGIHTPKQWEQTYQGGTNMEAAKGKYRGTKGEFFILKQTHFSLNIWNNMEYLTYDLVQCDSFNKWTIAWRWPSRAETCSNWCHFNVILNKREIVNSFRLH